MQNWEIQISLFTRWLQAAGRTESTIKTRLYWLNVLQHSYPNHDWETLTHEELSIWLSNPNWQPATRKAALASVRRFYHYLEITGSRLDNPTKLLLSIKTPRYKARPIPDETVAQAIAKATTSAETLMILLAAYAGLRRTEIASLHTSNYIDGWLKVKGKGGITRVIPVHGSLKPLLELKSNGYYFPGRFKGHRSSDNVAKTIKKMIGPAYTPHQLRHWFATKAYAATGDIRAVQDLLGHADIVTTQLYIGISEQSLVNAVKLLPTI
ncbi:tyrosine-type recombinase/integrase [Rothia sp. ZJ932]|uniref:tyrosine-type recombinase/integrase n=1 Tax=Rothia sp. ZJ932 TaxID=2810516 RepID=UPI00196814FA|nr:tyrosine-type recombinase/integrase [Rothia sp. ZJ932]QRZ61821.1 tyrosine-type recombinase/integrase [Rothia sp. ZJ932]